MSEAPRRGGRSKTMKKSVTILTLTLSLAACGPTGSSGSGGNGGGSGGAGGNTGGSSGSGTGGVGGGTGGPGGSGICGGVVQIDPGRATGAQYIYIVDENNHFFRYNPALPKGQ